MENTNATYTVQDGRTNATIPTNITSVAPNLVYFGLHSEMTFPINGFLSPVVIAFTLVTNTLVCVTLFSPSLRTPTNLILAALAVSDTVTGLSALPFFVYVYTAQMYTDYMYFHACWMAKFLADVFPTIFHTISIWLTVALGVQRYLHICKPTAAKTWCTTTNTIRAIGAIYIVGLLVHTVRLFDTHFVPVEAPSKLNDSRTVTGCRLVLNDWVRGNVDAFYGTYFWLRVVFIHLAPCTALVVFNVALIRKLRSALKKHNRLLSVTGSCSVSGFRAARDRSTDSNRTTYMLLLVVSIFLIVEFPLGIYFILYIIDEMGICQILSGVLRAYVGTIVNCFILLSYPLNFFIYCTMSRKFRRAFVGLFRVRGRNQLARETNNGAPSTREVYVSVPMTEQQGHETVRKENGTGLS